MNHTALISRAFEITRRYRVLWIFGILVALTSGGGGGNNSNFRFNREDLTSRGMAIPHGLDNFDPSAYIGWIALCCCLLVLLAIAAIIVNYVARAALYRMVDTIEARGAAPTWRQGFRLGWDRRTVRLFLLELIVGIAAFLAAAVVLAVAFSPLLLRLTGNEAARAIGTALGVVLGLPAVLLVIAAAIVLTLLGQFWSREIVLGDRGVGEALASGYALLRRNLKALGILWLLMAGIGIGFFIVMIPILIIVVLIALGLGGGLGYAVYSATGSMPWAMVAGLPVALAVLAVPLGFIGGLYNVFKSSAWTLAYREIVLRRSAPIAAG